MGVASHASPLFWPRRCILPTTNDNLGASFVASVLVKEEIIIIIIIISAPTHAVQVDPLQRSAVPQVGIRIPYSRALSTNTAGGSAAGSEPELQDTRYLLVALWCWSFGTNYWRSATCIAPGHLFDSWPSRYKKHASTDDQFRLIM